MASAAEEARSPPDEQRREKTTSDWRKQAEAPGPGGRGAARWELGDKEEDVPGEMLRPASSPVKRFRGWRPTTSVSRLVGRAR